MNITDPFLRDLVERAIRDGNTQLRDDLDPVAKIRKVREAQYASMLPDVPRETSSQPSAPIARLNLAQKFGPIPFVNAAPMHKQQVPRLLLRGLLAGYNTKAGFPGLDARGGAAGGGAAGGHVDPNNDLRRALLQAQIEATGALGNTRKARTDEINQPDDKTDPFEDEKRKWWESRTDANEALAESRRKPKPVAAGRGGGRSGGTGGKPLTMAQKRAQINALAQAEKQRVANNIKNKYREAYDYNNPTTGKPEGKRIVDAAIARGIAQVEQEHARVLRDLGSEYGMEQGTNAPVNAGGVDPNSPEGIAAAMRAAKGKK